jgi:carboxyl-terminal processing protease
MNTIIDFMKELQILLAVVVLSVTLFAFKIKSGVDSNPDKTNCS